MQHLAYIPLIYVSSAYSLYNDHKEKDKENYEILQIMIILPSRTLSTNKYKCQMQLMKKIIKKSEILCIMYNNNDQKFSLW